MQLRSRSDSRPAIDELHSSLPEARTDRTATERGESWRIAPEGARWNGCSLANLGVVGLHVGCGPRLFGGWVNADLTPFGPLPGPDWRDANFIALAGRLKLFQLEPEMRSLECWFERHAPAYLLRHDALQPFPFDDGTFDLIYSEHFIEHVSSPDAVVWLTEMRRLLRAGGTLRISTPDLEKWVDGYREPTAGFFETQRSQLEGAGIPMPKRRAFMLNQIFSWWGHKWLYDFDELRVVARAAGFDPAQAVRSNYRQSSRAELRQLDSEARRSESLYVEFTV